MKYKNEANTTMNICYTDIYDMEELDNRRLYINNDIDNEILIQLYIIFCVLIELIKIRNQKKGSQSYYTLTHQGGCLLWLWTYLCHAR